MVIIQDKEFDVAEAEVILENVQLKPGHEELDFRYDSHLGYAYAEGQGTRRFTALVGFTGQRQESVQLPGGSIGSITELDDVRPHERTIKMQARGVGTRMYNTVEALWGTGEGDDINAYMFRVDPKLIVDRRRAIDNTMRGRFAQAATQLGRVVQAEIIGLEATVGRIHDSFGAHKDAVLYNQSATMALQQCRHGGVKQLEGIPPEFMVIREPRILMLKIGEYRG